MSYETQSPQDLKDAFDSGKPLLLIDVRTPGEFKAMHVTGAVNLPLQNLTSGKVLENQSEKDCAVYVICQSGNRSRQACESLIAAGVAASMSMVGLPVVHRLGFPSFVAKASSASIDRCESQPVLLC
jgi:rhodanese-related sulfurtransferase